MSLQPPRRPGNPENLISHALKQVVQYENPSLQQHALSLLPLEALKKEGSECDEHEPKKCDVVDAVNCELCFLQALSCWFKNDFFSWVNSPKCQKCGGDTEYKSKTWSVWSLPRPRLSQISGRYEIEIENHLCSSCGSTTQFPRHTDVSILLETRSGRCSEWAQAFTLICRALGYRSRLVLDVTDHVWTEIYSNASSRWLHLDSCEAAVDRPLLYENGWGKRLSYIIGVGIDDVQDVAWRYSADHNSMRTRRTPEYDSTLNRTLIDTRNHLLRHFSSARRREILNTVVLELVELLVQPSVNGEYSGRTSGDKLWIQSRSEDGAKRDNEFVVELSQYKTDVNPSPIHIWYSSARDQYKIQGLVTEDVKKWQSIVYKAENVFRNKENDWQMTYLARRAASRDGLIEWRFDAGNNFVTDVRVVAGCLVKDDCDVTWRISGDDRVKTVAKNVESLAVTWAEPCQRLTVRVIFSSPPGKPDVAWQFAQIFREKLSKTEFDFGFVISIKSK